MSKIPETEWQISAQAEGVWIDGRYLPQSEAAQCLRCGLWRRVQPGRITSGLCRDCRAQQNADIDAWIHFHTIAPMPAEDLAWCLKQEKAFNERRPVIYYRTKQRKDVAA